MVKTESRAAEQSVVGGCMLNNDAYWLASAIVVESDFIDDFYRRCWSEISTAADKGEPFDFVTLSETSELPLADLAGLIQEVPGSANIETYARIVRDRAALRKGIAAAAEAIDRMKDGDMEALPEGALRMDSTEMSQKEVLAHSLDAIQAAGVAAQSPGGLVGAPTGIQLFDRKTGGLTGGKLIILAARPSLGKTALALQAVQAAAAAGYPTGVLSLEMGGDEIGIRQFAHQFQMNNTALSQGDAGTLDQLMDRLARDPERLEEFQKLPLYFDEDNFTINGIVARITEWHRKYGIKFAVIDHLQLVELPEGQSRNDGLGIITRKLKILAKRLDIPIMLLCQLNRNVEREKRKPQLSDLRDSGNIEQDADIVAMLAGDMEPDHNGLREVQLGFMKLRGGVVGWAGTMQFCGPTQTFRRLETREYGD